MNQKCNICGDQIDQSYKFCPSCGAKLDEPEDNKVRPSSGLGDKKSGNLNKGKKSELKTGSDVKQISTTKLVYLFLGLIIIGGLIVFSSGIFEKPSVADESIQGNMNNPHAGVDLKSLEEINKLEELVKNNPADKESLLHLAHLLNDSGFKEKAIEKYISYLKIDSQNSDVWVDMGVCYFELGNNEEAIVSMEKALNYNPKHQIAHLNLGIVNMSAGNVAISKKWLQKAFDINPGNEIGKRAQELLKSH